MQTSGLAAYRRQYAKLKNAGLSTVSRFLGPDYPLPSSVCLHIVSPGLRINTCKQHYYEKLCFMGKNYLEIECQKYLFCPSGETIGKPNFMFDKPSLQLDTKELLAKYVDAAGLRRSLLYQNQTLMESKQLKSLPVTTDELKTQHAIDSLYLFIGAIYSWHGPTKARNFINDRVIGGSEGLMRMAL